MSRTNDLARPDTASPVRGCFMCGAHAVFGFTTRSGSVWTCTAHRADGDRRLVPPAQKGLWKPDASPLKPTTPPT